MDSNSARGSTGQLSSTGSTGGGMHHSHSTPAGVDGGARTPPATPKKGGKMLAIRVQMLDDTVTMFQVQAKATGRVLFDQVCKQLHLLEADYFGLEYIDVNGTRYWMDLQKPISRQLGLSLVDPLLYFCVKFYTPDPGQLEEEYTRYLFCLQVKRDLAQGLMQCNENTAALMASYIVQAECGDYVSEDYPDHTYLSSYKFVPQQDQEMERKIMENHKKHSGQSPAEADLNLLETARRCELYGIKMHPAKDHENVPLNLAVAHMGIIVFQNYTKINTFSWAKIRKISFKRKRFLIKLHPEGYGYYKDTVEFFFEGRNECKNFWKKCVENHGFFRCSSVKNVSRHKTRVLSRGSSFRYSGKTQKQIVEFVRDNYVKRQTFQRSASFRHSSAHSSASNMHSSTVGNSISAHPLLPLADSTLSVEASKLSASLSSMADARTITASPTTRSASRHPVTATSWSSAPDTRPIHVQTTTSPSPPLTTQSASPPTSATTSPLHTDHPKGGFASSPVAVRAAVHRADTDDIQRNKSDNEDSYYIDNSYYTSSPPSYKEVNGNISEMSPIKNLAKEQLLNSINANTNGTNTTTIIAEIEGEVKKKTKPIDKTYYIAKEILMTELTYKKDLDVINVWFRDEVGKEEPDECSILLTLIAPLAQAHGHLVKDLEQRLQGWDGRGGPRATTSQKIADVLLTHLPPLLPIYEEYLDGHILVLERLDAAFKQNSHFEQLYRDFETQKVCYLPLTTFVLKPLHRLLQYQSLLQRLLRYYGPSHPDRADCLTASDTLKDLMQPVCETLEHSENLATLCELQRDLVGFDNLIQPGRKFIRHGCLLKHSKKGYQQRMFFLFSDILLYTSRSQATLQFKVHGHMPLRGVLIEEPEGELATYGLVIYGGNRALTVAASSQEEKERWKQDLQNAIQEARDKTDTKITYLSLKSCSSSDEIMDQCGNDVGTQTKPQPQRSNLKVHVCWHRNTSISMKDELVAVENQLSGYLLRKFKSSNGWQKLWVVLTSFCLFFYKGCMDDFPLASLPLLGYTVGPPAPEDAIGKDYVFKLQYKNHVYFFRAESEYTYNRWMEVIGSSTQSRKKKQIILNENSIECSPEK
ncbi:FERM, ARHGEF and pleckstrin domain-containing protein 1-like isoform X1 [Tribolium madens]|uniref:FERM, ARHGEF and pleckstrin domain-containing protein 1-like isoform X1 n=1 Tax=Tribolium madens TaxID=41895 RepID=UPI001CF7567F|nr:FERM, ARHGEF and pleckstrin domain-containing protein 1-like isoform X1 [Tribolium madens]XP_044268601.1 FERM, ARHGEF and pleckstrin domain-containing protein 1-like isoform X1 [Tribolium madens]